MSAKILPTSSSSPSKLRRHGGTGSTLSGRRRPIRQSDAALVVGLALAFSRQGDSAVSAIPPLLIDRLRRYALSGDPACSLVLDWLSRKTNARHDLAGLGDLHAVQHAGLAEIVSGPATVVVEER
jgi:hypothetical protein